METVETIPFNATLPAGTNLFDIEEILQIQLHNTFVSKSRANKFVLDCEVMKMYTPYPITNRRGFIVVPCELKYTSLHYPVGYHLVIRLKNVIINQNETGGEDIVYDFSVTVPDIGLSEQHHRRLQMISDKARIIIYKDHLDSIGQSIAESLDIGEDIIAFVKEFMGDDGTSKIWIMTEIAKYIPSIPVVYTKDLNVAPILDKSYQYLVKDKIVSNPTVGNVYGLSIVGLVDVGGTPVSYLDDKFAEYIENQRNMWEELALIIPKANFNKNVRKFLEKL